MMADIASLKGLWGTMLAFAVAFGFAPGAMLRIIVLLLPKTDARRQELIAELYAVPRMERPTWVFEQLEICLFEGITLRRRERMQRKAARSPQEAWERFASGQLASSVVVPILTALLIILLTRNLRYLLIIALVPVTVLLCGYLLGRRRRTLNERVAARVGDAQLKTFGRGSRWAYVRPYRRKDGTYVRAHFRNRSTAANQNLGDN